MYFGFIGFGIAVLLVGIILGLVIQILFLLNLMRLLEAVQPQNRAMTPGLVWLNLIPVFSLGWMIYTVIKIKESVGRENAARWGASVSEGSTHTIGLVYAILAAAGFVLSYAGYASVGFSAFGGFVSLATLILWIIYWVGTNRIKRGLRATAGRGYGPPGAYGPGGQYGAGGPYAPGGPGYGQGGPGGGPGGGTGNAGYGPGGAGYGAGYSPNPNEQQRGASEQWWQSPTWPPRAGQETPPPEGGKEPQRKCSQCGSELNPDDAFCGACGTPASKQ